MEFGRHIKGLFDFSGRENRQPFWLWVLVTYVIQMGLSMIVTIPVMVIYIQRIMMMARQDQSAFADNPEAAQKAAMQIMAPMMNAIMIAGALVAVVWAVLLAAAAVRRLHDSGRAGWWAAPYFTFHLVIPFVVAGVMPQMFEKMPYLPPDASQAQVQAAMGPFFQSFAWISALGGVQVLLLIVMIVLLCMPGTPGPNRYGEDPLGLPAMDLS